MTCERTLQQLADLVDGQVIGDPHLVIQTLNGLEHARAGEITFIQDAKQATQLAQCHAAACIVPLGIDAKSLPLPSLMVANPSLAAALIHNHLLAEPFKATGIHPSAVIGESCQIPAKVSIGPLVCLGDRVILGERVSIQAGVSIGNEVIIGDDSVINANVTIAERCQLGCRVIVQHGAVIGSDGFGFATDARGQHHRRPQVGTVVLEDDVEIGANACVDRAAFGVTRIGQGTKIDNLVMIGHNVEIGPHCILCGQVGIAGSSRLGRNVVLGAKAGVSDHIHLGDQVMVSAMSGVHNNQPQGVILGGCPAFDAKQWGRSTAAYSRLPEMLKELRRLKKEVEALRAQSHSPKPVQGEPQ